MRRRLLGIWEGEADLVRCLLQKPNPSGPLEPFPTTPSSMTDKGSARKIYSMSSKRTLCTKRLPTVDEHAIDKSPPLRYDPQVGYCQGLPFVVAILLLNVRAAHFKISSFGVLSIHPPLDA